MLSRVLATGARMGWRSPIAHSVPLPGPALAARKPLKLTPARTSGALIPPSQYDIPISKKFKFPGVLAEYWELVPMFVTTAAAILLVFCAFLWAAKNKVDVVFSTHSCNNISRTMNLRRPTVHKFIVINQRYAPWPEMQEVLDKMLIAEHRVLMRANTCSYEQREGHPPIE